MGESLFEEDPQDNDDEMNGAYTISGAGLEHVANWARFQLELHRMAPEVFGEENSEDELADDAKLAYLIWFLVREAYENRGMQHPGVAPGELFPSEWNDD